jgi:hypothetical protein
MPGGFVRVGMSVLVRVGMSVLRSVHPAGLIRANKYQKGNNNPLYSFGYFLNESSSQFSVFFIQGHISGVVRTKTNELPNDFWSSHW